MIGRMAVLISDLPEEVSGWTVTRYGCEGLQAVISQAQAIMSGCGDIMIAAGVENMSRYPLMAPLESALKSGYPMSPHPNFEKRGGFVMMSTAAEMIGNKYGIYREDMDRYSLRSHQKAVKAMRDTAWYEKRVIPVHISPNGHAGKTVSLDEFPRGISLDDPNTAWDNMEKLEPRFKRRRGDCRQFRRQCGCCRGRYAHVEGKSREARPQAHGHNQVDGCSGKRSFLPPAGADSGIEEGSQSGRHHNR